ncbi:MAG: type II toxin-antitoxin system RelE/ParE family toxin [Hyphomonas sp.]|nr:type II toxin-antitoxin system RelE/ParE family toxin [Hyphomonas sp.]MDP3459103.1 type II toxin-antitoxin system RelE/ParE family toxin [Hyphomonas sp.]
MIEIEQTEGFRAWFEGLRDGRVKQRISARLTNIMAKGSFGDHRSVGSNVSELRFHFGPGYRIYYTLRGETLVLLLAGGDKSSQARDIRKAIQLAEEQ